jgi:hypothetical protein
MWGERSSTALPPLKIVLLSRIHEQKSNLVFAFFFKGFARDRALMGFLYESWLLPGRGGALVFDCQSCFESLARSQSELGRDLPPDLSAPMLPFWSLVRATPSFGF